MIQPIIKDINVLRKPCLTVEQGEDIAGIVQDLKDTLATQKGYGLTANQIGVHKKLAYYNVSGKENILINPKMHTKYDRILFDEACLSFPSVIVRTDRYKEIVFENNGIECQASGLEAIVIQHEIDHLNGRTIFDRKHKAR